MPNEDPKKNASGCLDLTAYEAIENIEHEVESEARFRKFLAMVFYLCDLAGFHLENRIEVKDKRTGKVWR